MAKGRIKTFIIQIFIFAVFLFVFNCFAWLVLNIAKDATFVDTERWEKSSAFDNKSYASELYDENQMFKSKYFPFSVWKQTTYTGKYIKTNDDGERNYDLSKPDNNMSVGLFGGSTMWGVGASDDSTIASFLSKINPELNVYNHGMQGYNSRQSLDKLITLYQQEKFSDIVIFYDGVNELSMCSNTISLPGHFQEDLIREKITNRNTILKPADIIINGLSDLFVSSSIAFTRKINNKIFHKDSTAYCTKGYICDCDVNRASSIAKLLVNNWIISKTIVESKGGVFIAILQPVFSEGKPNVSYLNVDKKDYLINYKKNYNSLYKQIKKEIELRKLDWVYDFTDVLDGEEPHFIDFCHINSSGNSKLAKKFNLVIKNAVRIKTNN